MSGLCKGVGAGGWVRVGGGGEEGRQLPSKINCSE